MIFMAIFLIKFDFICFKEQVKLMAQWKAPKVGSLLDQLLFNKFLTG